MRKIPPTGSGCKRNLTADPFDRVLEALGPRVVSRNSSSAAAHCPAHNDRRASLSVSRGDDGRGLLHCHRGCALADILAALGLELSDLFPPKETSPKPAVVAKYDYQDESGELLYQVLRYHPKDFRQRRPDGNGGWDWSVKGVRRVPYRLPQLLSLPPLKGIVVVEGEKDVEALEALGVAATTSPGGAEKWCKLDPSTVRATFTGRRVLIIPDADEAGRKHARQVAENLVGIACDVRVVELPGLAECGDASDWISAGGTRAQLAELAQAAPAFTGEPERAEEAEDEGPAFAIGRRMSDVQPKEVSWLWPGRIARGKVTLLAGDPGLGKSLLSLDIAARTSTGAPWPDGEPERREPAGVVLVSAEDDPADTIRPRLDAAGADVSRIVTLEGVRERDRDTGEERRAWWSITRHLAALREQVKAAGNCGLVLVDPVAAFLGGVDSHVNAEVRGALGPLGELAAELQVAIVGVHHLNKSSSGSALHRASGSLAFTALARAAWLVARDPEDSAGRRRLLLSLKNNLCEDVGGLAFGLEAAGATVRIAWERDPIWTSADDVLAAGSGRGRGADSAAAAWLRDELADGPRAAKDLVRDAREAGISEKQLRQGREDLGVRPAKSGFGGGWIWSLPGFSGGEDDPAGEGAPRCPRKKTRAPWASSTNSGSFPGFCAIEDAEDALDPFLGHLRASSGDVRVERGTDPGADPPSGGPASGPSQADPCPRCGKGLQSIRTPSGWHPPYCPRCGWPDPGPDAGAPQEPRQEAAESPKPLEAGDAYERLRAIAEDASEDVERFRAEGQAAGWWPTDPEPGEEARL
ncbi:MAG: AAA family ATPase [Planctomycetes bacterium]|nr:AAA family ATPase [Planctomycetota bacterium]